jgi:hypothetical protein
MKRTASGSESAGCTDRGDLEDVMMVVGEVERTVVMVELKRNEEHDVWNEHQTCAKKLTAVPCDALWASSSASGRA